MAESISARLKRWSRRIKRDVHALYFAGRDPRVPWHAKALAATVAAYALSPLDLIPDFIPVLGLLDEAVLLPLGILLAIRLIPPQVMADCRARADAVADRPASRIGTAAVVTLWLVALLVSAWLTWRWLYPTHAG